MARKSVFIAGDQRFETSAPGQYQAAVSARLTYEGMLRWMESDEWEKIIRKRWRKNTGMTRDEFVEMARITGRDEVENNNAKGVYAKPTLQRWFYVQGYPAQALQQAIDYATNMQKLGYWDMIHAGYCEE